jgi:phenylacetate-coenzyme A ligase PaaK-like adenylate-forming protein
MIGQTLRLVRTALREKRVLLQRPEQIMAAQQRRLRSLVAWAKERSPFYAERFKHIDPQRCELSDLPTLTKTIMMHNFDRFVTDRRLRLVELEEFVGDPSRLGQWYLGEYAPSRTSGTQGLKAMIVQDRGMMELLFALQMVRGSTLPSDPVSMVKRVVRRARLAVLTIGRGFYPSASMLAYAPRATNVFMRQLWLQHFEPLPEVVNQLNCFRPHILLAYANVLELLAREELAGRLRLGRAGALQQIVNMSEPLSTAAHRLIREAFSVAVTNNYGLGECMALTTGCPQGHGMHVNADWVVLEVVDRQNRLVEASRPGDKVLITNLYNHVQPFIRYEVEDVVSMSPTPCPCGSPLPLILKVEGRTDESVWVRVDGRFRHVHPFVFVDVLDECPQIGFYQIVQTERNRFSLRAAPAPGRQVTGDELDGIMRRGLARYGLADVIRFDVEITPDIAPDAQSGKLRRITSRVGPPEELSVGNGVADASALVS